MHYRSLGKSGIQISLIGFGAWGIGGATPDVLSYGPTNDAESSQALQTALELGINFFDTAPLYGKGHSETLLGQSFAHCRDAVVYASKTPYGPELLKSENGLRKALKESLHGSLKRLNTDYLDLLQLHDTPVLEILAQPEILIEMETLRQEGWIRALGISLKSPEEGIQLLDGGFVPDAIQVNFNLTDQRALELGLFQRCASLGIGTIVRTPLCFGFLTQTYQEAEFNPQDHRSQWPKSQIERWENAYSHFQTWLPAMTPAQQSLRFCCSAPGVSTVIPGMLTVKQVQENAIAGTLPPLEPEVMHKLFEIYQKQVFFIPPKKM